MVKLKLLDATRKAVLEKQKRPVVSTAMQTDTVKTKLCKDKLIDTQDLIEPKDAQTETDVDLITLKAKDGTGRLMSFNLLNFQKKKNYSNFLNFSNCHI